MQQDKPSWDEFFLLMAHVAKLKSKDAQTKCGAILTRGKDLIGMGYNSFPRDMEDDKLPNTRPDKYLWTKHAEANLLINCARNGHSTIGCTCYITGEPCFNCLGDMMTAGIDRIVYDIGKDASRPVMIDNKQKEMKQEFLEKSKRKIEIVEIELDKEKFNY